MASESVILGTPAVYLDLVGRGYTDEQETHYGLCFNYREPEKAIAKSEEILSQDLKNDSDFRRRYSKMMSDKIDLTEFILRRLTEEGVTN
jgi:predicted glycosyltransferase